jgi:processive 1,2-diacylglycerol beta-glucosyltransferase
MKPDQVVPTAGAKVLLLTASVGVGHNSAARAIQAGLALRAPEVSVELIDVLSLTSKWFRLVYAGGYALLVSRFPFLYGVGFWASNRRSAPGRSLLERRRLWSERRAAGSLARDLLDTQPDVIVHTHFLAPPMIGRMIRGGRLRSRQMVAITDADAHRYWYAESVDHWFASSPKCVQRLQDWGIDPERITQSGIPLHPKWSETLDRGAILSDWDLPSDKPILLLSGGTDFTCGPVTRIARDLIAHCPEAVVVVLIGNNKQLAARLAKVVPSDPRLRIVSFTDRVHELVEVASIMITKAGGITTAECLTRAKPMVLLKPVPGQESSNAAYFEAEGAALVARNRSDVVAHVRRLLDDPIALDALSRNARRLAGDGTPAIVEAVLRAVATRGDDCATTPAAPAAPERGRPPR